MAIDLDDEILQDFLIEAGEILEQLGEQLVDLESRPADKDLLNAVFRGFHTIKGGAGFVNLQPLVAVCHRAEDVFNTLRQGHRVVDAHLMDVILHVLDVVNRMFASIRQGEEPSPADARLLSQLEELSAPGGAVQDVTEVGGQTPDGDPDESRAVQAERDVEASAAPDPAAEISEEEFEHLLDQLHGPGVQPGTAAPEPVAETATAAPGPASAGSKDITDEEFEGLLDALHGRGGAPGKPHTAAQQDADAGDPDHGGHAPTVDSAAPEPFHDQAAPAIASPLADTAETGEKRAVKDAAQTEATIRVDTKRLDDIMNLVGELVLVRNRLSTLRTAVENEEVDKAVGNLDLVTSDLQAAAMKTRMQPIKKIFGRFPRVVRDIARYLEKEVVLELVGEETDLDKNLVEALADPLVHLVRNAVDHGIESPETREAAGKPRRGTIVLSAKQSGDHIELAIRDDGAGMDPEVLRKKAVEKGIVDRDAAERMDQRECFGLIFMPGFSTKDAISDVSGRGVGMDVVKNRISSINGAIEIESIKGQGTCITIKVPLTLAILPTLMVVVGSRIFALPLANVSEIFDLEPGTTKTVDGRRVVMVRNSVLPIFFLAEWLFNGSAPEATEQSGHVVVVKIGAQNVGFVVDKLIGQEEVVIKPLGSLLRGMRGLAGATITGDGRIALILDVPGLISKYSR